MRKTEESLINSVSHIKLTMNIQIFNLIRFFPHQIIDKQTSLNTEVPPVSSVDIKLQRCPVAHLLTQMTSKCEDPGQEEA